jgi:hypothetical protein
VMTYEEAEADAISRGALKPQNSKEQLAKNTSRAFMNGQWESFVSQRLRSWTEQILREHYEAGTAAS